MDSYTFRVGPVILEVFADSKAQAVREANASLSRLADELGAPGNFSRVAVVLDRKLTAKDIVEE